MSAGFRGFKIWRALWAHFRSPSYDAVKHNGRTAGVEGAFDKRANKLVFVKFERMFNEVEMGQFLIANFLHGNFNVPFEILPEDIIVFNEYRKRRQAQTYFFEQDINRLIDRQRPNVPTISKDENCILFSSAIAKAVSAETLCILDTEFHFLDEWHTALTTSIFSDIVMRWCKYRSFVHFDRDKIEPIMSRLNTNLSNNFVPQSSFVSTASFEKEKT